MGNIKTVARKLYPDGVFKFFYAQASIFRKATLVLKVVKTARVPQKENMCRFAEEYTEDWFREIQRTITTVYIYNDKIKESLTYF